MAGDHRHPLHSTRHHRLATMTRPAPCLKNLGHTSANQRHVEAERVFDLQLLYCIANPLCSFEIAACPSTAQALTNCLIVHQSDFQQGQHVLVNGSFPITVR